MTDKLAQAHLAVPSSRRIDRRALDAARYPFILTVQTRFSDVDTLGHINNVAALYILQEGRAGFLRLAGLLAHSDGARLLVAGQVVEYAAEMYFPDQIEVMTGIAGIGQTSFTLAQIARQGGRTGLYCESTLVLSGVSGPSPLPMPLKAVLESHAIVPDTLGGTGERNGG